MGVAGRNDISVRSSTLRTRALAAVFRLFVYPYQFCNNLKNKDLMALLTVHGHTNNNYNKIFSNYIYIYLIYLIGSRG